MIYIATNSCKLWNFCSNAFSTFHTGSKVFSMISLLLCMSQSFLFYIFAWNFYVVGSLWHCSHILNQMEIFCAPAEMRGRRVSKISKPQYKRILNHFIKQCVKNRMFVILLSCILLPSLDSGLAIQTKFIQA